MKAIAYATVDSPIGELLLEGSEGGLKSLRIIDGNRRPTSPRRPATGPLAEAARQLAAFFAGDRHDFDIAIDPDGTPFQLRVWRELQRIPYGTTISYAELARRVGNPRAARAVGAANGANPIAIVIPCHRVIGSGGELTGYAGGIGIKQRLLALEQGALAL